MGDGAVLPRDPTSAATAYSEAATALAAVFAAAYDDAASAAAAAAAADAAVAAATYGTDAATTAYTDAARAAAAAAAYTTDTNTDAAAGAATDADADAGADADADVGAEDGAEDGAGAGMDDSTIELVSEKCSIRDCANRAHHKCMKCFQVLCLKHAKMSRFAIYCDPECEQDRKQRMKEETSNMLRREYLFRAMNNERSVLWRLVLCVEYILTAETAQKTKENKECCASARTTFLSFITSAVISFVFFPLGIAYLQSHTYV